MSAVKYKKVFNKVCTISQEVANEISPFLYSDKEDWYQTALAYEFENNKLKATKELNITQYYKEIPFTELKVDFFLHKEKLDVPQGLLVETKVAQTTEADIDKWVNGIPKNTGGVAVYRKQLFRYIYSIQYHKSSEYNKADTGVLIYFSSAPTPAKEIEEGSVVGNFEIGLELWQASNKKRTNFKLLDSYKTS